ncbi:MAG: glycosyltransferase family 4 protein [Candidatus Omnitrophota bacterium]
MKLLNISNMPLWLWGKEKGIPDVWFPQKAFIEAGWDIHFLCPVKEGVSQYSFNNGIHIHTFDFPFNLRGNAYLQTNTFWRKIRASLLSNLHWFFFQIFSAFLGIRLGLKVRPDIIYAHTPASIFSAFLASRIVSAKLVLRFYGVRQLYWQWDNLWLRLKEIRDYATFLIPADAFIITDDGTHGDRVARRLGVIPEKISFWRIGIDEKMFEVEPDAKEAVCRKLNIPLSSKIILSTARLNHEYGVDILVEVLPQLLEEKEELVCVIAGGGPKENSLKAFVKKHSLSSRVFFMGIVDRGMIKRLLDAADIFVLLSRYHNCTNTLWEAMVCGRCIVTAENEAVKEVLTSGRNAVLFSPEQIQEVPAILKSLSEDEVLRKRLGEAARQRAREVLEPWTARTKKEIELLKRLVS